MDKVFDLEQLSINLIEDGAPIDVSNGCVIDGDFLKIAKETAEETQTRKGTKGESYTVLSVEDNIRNVEVTYLPGSSPVVVLQRLRQAKKRFGIAITNNSEPKYKFFAPSCVIAEEPETVVNGKEGFKDYVFKIRCSESNQVWGV
jgi:hypothetical protein